MADRRGRRGVFLAGLGVFAVGAAGSALAPSLELLIAARVVQAVGAALVLPTSLVAVLPSYPPERHATVVSLWSSMGVVGATVGPTISAGLLTAGGWRAVFAVAAPVALVAAVVGAKTLPDSRPDVPPGPLDVIGAIAGTALVGGVAFAVVQGRVWGWLAPPVLAAAVAGLVGGVVFVRRSLHHPEPLGLVVGPLNSAALSAIPTASLGAANAAFNTLRFLGTALGVALAAAILGDTTGAARSDAFTLAPWVLTALSTVSPLVLAAAYPRSKAGPD